MTFRSRLRALAVLMTIALVMSATPAAAAPAEAPPGETIETIVYRWRLQGVSGAFAGLFFPRRGEGILRQSLLANGHRLSELLITSPDSGKGEFWNYGAEFDALSSNTVRAWSSYLFRGKRQAKNQEVKEQDVTDITAGIHRLRVERPRSARRQRIWSDGKIYDVQVIPHGAENIDLGEGARPLADRYSIEGAAGPGGRVWKGRIEVWLARDAAATPVQIQIERGWASILLVQKPKPETEEAP